MLGIGKAKAGKEFLYMCRRTMVELRVRNPTVTLPNLTHEELKKRTSFFAIFLRNTFLINLQYVQNSLRILSSKIFWIIFF